MEKFKVGDRVIIPKLTELDKEYLQKGGFGHIRAGFKAIVTKTGPSMVRLDIDNGYCYWNTKHLVLSPSQKSTPVLKDLMNSLNSLL